MLKYIPIAFIAIVCQTLANTASTGMNIRLEQGELDSAHTLLTSVWMFSSAAIIMYALIGLLLILDLRKLDK